MSDFTGRYGPWALVVGASEGIGAAFSRRIAAEGVDLVLVARRPGPLEELAGELRAAHGVEVRVASVDLGVPGAESALLAATEGLEVGLVVFNAGADTHNARFLDVDPDAWAAMVRRNCIVPLLTTHHYAAAMTARGRGGLVFVTSGAAWAGGARLTTYGATKAFDLVFGEGLWAELRRDGVDVLSLVVGATDTPALQQSLANFGATVDGLADPDDVARAGLEHLGDGPTWSMGMPDGGGPGYFGTVSRREAVEMMTAGNDALFGPG